MTHSGLSKVIFADVGRIRETSALRIRGIVGPSGSGGTVVSGLVAVGEVVVSVVDAVVDETVVGVEPDDVAMVVVVRVVPVVGVEVAVVLAVVDGTARVVVTIRTVPLDTLVTCVDAGSFRTGGMFVGATAEGPAARSTVATVGLVLEVSVRRKSLITRKTTTLAMPAKASTAITPPRERRRLNQEVCIQSRKWPNRSGLYSTNAWRSNVRNGMVSSLVPTMDRSGPKGSEGRVVDGGGVRRSAREVDSAASDGGSVDTGEGVLIVSPSAC